MTEPVKRGRQPGDSPPAKEGKTTPYPCVVCAENVVDGGIECEWCGLWEHGECADLTEDELKVLNSINSCVKFFCKVCQPKVEVAFKYFESIQEKQNSIVSKVQNIEENLSKSVADLSSRLDQVNKRLKDHHTPSSTSVQQTISQDKGAPSFAESLQNATINQLPINKSVKSDNSTDRKFNVVIYGIKENPSGTPRSARTKSDIDSCVHILKQANDDITEQSIRDCLRLGKFGPPRTKPRPLLVKLSRAFDVNIILHNRSKISEGIQVKADMNKEERLCEQLLLRERWKLITSGTDKKQIKIRGTKLFLNNQIYGEIISSNFVPKIRSPTPTSSGGDPTMDTDGASK